MRNCVACMFFSPFSSQKAVLENNNISNFPKIILTEKVKPLDVHVFWIHPVDMVQAKTEVSVKIHFGEISGLK